MLYNPLSDLVCMNRTEASQLATKLILKGFQPGLYIGFAIGFSLAFFYVKGILEDSKNNRKQ